MNLNLGSLLGLIWGLQREKKRAAEDRSMALALRIDEIFMAMQEVVVDGRDEMIRRGWNKAGKPVAGKLTNAFTWWATRDRSTMARYSEEVDLIRVELGLIPDIGLVDQRPIRRWQALLPDLSAFLHEFVDFFDAVLAPREDFYERFTSLNRSWTELSESWPTLPKAP